MKSIALGYGMMLIKITELSWVQIWGAGSRFCFVADTNFVSETQKIFLIFVRNILRPQKVFPRLCDMDTKQMFCVPLVCPSKKHHEQKCVRNIMSSFATSLNQSVWETYEVNCARVWDDVIIKITELSGVQIWGAGSRFSMHFCRVVKNSRVFIRLNNALGALFVSIVSRVNTIRPSLAYLDIHEIKWQCRI